MSGNKWEDSSSNANLVTTEEEYLTTSQICCLLDRNFRCTRVAGVTTLDNNMQRKCNDLNFRLKLDVTAAHLLICDYHSNVFIPKKRLRKAGRSPKTPKIEINLNCLKLASFRRYREIHNLPVPQNAKKRDMVKYTYNHLMSLQLDEKEVIDRFINLLRRSENLEIRKT